MRPRRPASAAGRTRHEGLRRPYGIRHRWRQRRRYRAGAGAARAGLHRRHCRYPPRPHRRGAEGARQPARHGRAGGRVLARGSGTRRGSGGGEIRRRDPPVQQRGRQSLSDHRGIELRGLGLAHGSQPRRPDQRRHDFRAAHDPRGAGRLRGEHGLDGGFPRRRRLRYLQHHQVRRAGLIRVAPCQPRAARHRCVGAVPRAGQVLYLRERRDTTREAQGGRQAGEHGSGEAPGGGA